MKGRLPRLTSGCRVIDPGEEQEEGAARTQVEPGVGYSLISWKISENKMADSKEG